MWLCGYVVNNYDKKMQNPNIVSHADLLAHIAQLKVEKRQQEAEIKQNFRDFTQGLNPVAIIKQSLGELAEDKTVQFNLTKMGLIAGTDFVIDQVLGRNRSVKGFLSSVLVEKFTGDLINNNASAVLAGISNLMLRIAEKGKKSK